LVVVEVVVVEGQVAPIDDPATHEDHGPICDAEPIDRGGHTLIDLEDPEVGGGGSPVHSDHGRTGARTIDGDVLSDLRELVGEVDGAAEGRRELNRAAGVAGLQGLVQTIPEVPGVGVGGVGLAVRLSTGRAVVGERIHRVRRGRRDRAVFQDFKGGANRPNLPRRFRAGLAGRAIAIQEAEQPEHTLHSFPQEDANELASFGCETKAKSTDVSAVKTSKAAGFHPGVW
jgi:hypothetical protein